MKVVLTDEAAKRLDDWWESHKLLPLVNVVHGRVTGDARVSKDFWVDLPWARPAEQKELAEKLAREIKP